jgi:hypothetical protein
LQFLLFLFFGASPAQVSSELAAIFMPAGGVFYISPVDRQPRPETC